MLLFPLLIILSSFMLKSFYDISVRTINGNILSMSDYKNKKLMIVILSTEKTDTAYLQSLDSLSRQYADSITMIGVPAYEGSQPDSVTALQNYYQTYLGSQFIITEMMYTTKASGRQNELFEWLSNKDENQHFDMDAAGAGTKYFINGNGELYGVFVPQIPLSGRLINRMIF